MARPKKRYGVITGDIIGSTRMNATHRRRMLKSLNDLDPLLKKAGYPLLMMELFRGDSFQLLFSETHRLMEIALIIRASLRSLELKESGQIDARLGIGIGPVEYKAKSLSESDGTAFRLAADALVLANQHRLANGWILTGDTSLDRHLNAINVAWEPLVSNWTPAQAKSMTGSLQGLIHQEIAKKLKVTQPTVTRALQSANDKVIHYLLAYCDNLLSAEKKT
jgi:hypothetical protein